MLLVVRCSSVWTKNFLVLPWWLLLLLLLALASGTAFILAQGMDIAVFNRWRSQSWWKAPFMGSMVASVVDTLVFFSIAFYGSDMNWLMLATGDLAMKWLMAVLLLAPYRLMLPRISLWVPQAR